MSDVFVTEEAVAVILAAAAAALPRETGGVLIGVRSGGRPWVTRAVEVADPRATPLHYRLDGVGRRAAVRTARREDRRLGYLGEWHSHPADVGPSARDRLAMSTLALDPRAGTRTPLLVIARARVGGWGIDPYRVSRGVLRSVEQTLTGLLTTLETEGTVS